MAAKAILISDTFLIEDILNFMRDMAIRANRESIRSLFPKFAFNNFSMNDFNFLMAFSASSGDIFSRDRRLRIGWGEDFMSRMARSAISGDRETFLEQTDAVDTFGIIFQNMILGDMSLDLDFSTFAVARAADKRNFNRSHSGANIFNRQNFMRAMAILATRSKGIAFSNGFTVNTLGVLFLFVIMARDALSRSDISFMREIRINKIGMTIRTLIAIMDRSGEFFFVDIGRNSMSVYFTRESFIRMASKAIAIRLSK